MRNQATVNQLTVPVGPNVMSESEGMDQLSGGGDDDDDDDVVAVSSLRRRRRLSSAALGSPSSSAAAAAAPSSTSPLPASKGAEVESAGCEETVALSACSAGRGR